MKIEINVQAPEIVNALNNLATAMGAAPVAVKDSEPKVDKKEDKKGNKSSAKNDKKAEKEEDKQDKKEEKKVEETKAPTVEEVRAKTAEAAKAGKKDEIKDLLSKFDVSAVSKIPEDKRAEYLGKLAEL